MVVSTLNKTINYLIKILEKVKKDSLYRNSFYIMLSTVVMTGLGFFFWTINTRLFEEQDIGLATTIISSMSLLVSITGLGLGQALIRFLPTSKTKNKKINTCFTITFLVSIIAATVFLYFLDFFSPKLLFIKKNLYFSIAFMFIVASQALFLLLDSVFTAYRENHFTLIKNSIFSILKLLFPFALVIFGAFGIFAAWGLSSFIAFVVGIAMLVKKNSYRFQLVIYDDMVKKIGKYSFANYISGLIGAIPSLILPLMITNILEPETTAYYYVSMMIAGLLFTIPQSISTSLFAEGSKNENSLDKNIRKSFKFSFLLIIPAVIITIILAKYLLLLFGKSYSDNGSTLLNIFAVSSIIIVIKSVYMTTLNVKKKIGKMITINIIISTAIILLTSLSLSRGYGLNGIGYAWLTSQLLILPFAFWMIIRNFIPRREKIRVPYFTFLT